MWRPVLWQRRWHWAVSGLVNFILVFIVALVCWFIFVDWRLPIFIPKWWFFLGSAIAGWGILMVVVQIWFDHRPYSRMKGLLAQGAAGTLLNFVLVAVIFAVFWFIVGPYMVPMFSPFALMNVPAIGGNWWLALFLSSSAIGTILACGFSFATIWAAGAMYWPFTELEQPKRGFAVFLMGAIITMVTWLFLFWPFQISTALPPTTTTVNWTIWTALPFWAFDPLAGEVNNGGAYLSLAFTQWVITFGLLTLMSWDYQPWKALKKQPWIGVAALVGCTLLGGIVAFFLMPMLLWPVATYYGTTSAMHGFSAWIAVFITVNIFIWSQYFDNWPRHFSTPVNLLIRTIIVFVLGFVSLWVYFFVSPFLFGDFLLTGSYNPITWLLWLLWFMLLHVYIWKRAPGWKSV